MKIESSAAAALPRGGSGVKGEYFTALESWRGIAALMVVVGHVCWIHPLFYVEIIRRSYLMVDFFFILSGFVVSLNYEGQIHNAITSARFIWLRFWRLYPLHFVFLMVFVGIEVFKYIAGRSAGLVANHPAFSENNFHAFIMNLLLLQSLNTTSSGTFNLPSWSISTEFYTYAVFALFILSFQARLARLGFAAVVSAACFFLIRLHGNSNLNFSYDFGFVRCLAEFFLGVIAFYLYAIARNYDAWRRPDFMAVLQAVSVAGFVAAVFAGESRVSDFFTLVPLFFVILSFALGTKTLAARALAFGPVRWLGRVSYSIYMTHDMVLWVLNQVLRVVFHVPNLKGWARSDQAILDTSLATGTIFLIVALALVLVVSHFTFEYIEEPCRKWSRATLARWEGK